MSQNQKEGELNVDEIVKANIFQDFIIESENKTMALMPTLVRFSQK